MKKNVIKNIGYALKNIWKWDKTFYLFFIPTILLAVLMPIANTYYPKLLIDSIESKQSIENIVLINSIYFGALLIVTLANSFCNNRLQMRRYSLSILYQNAINEKYMRTDFSNVDNPALLIKYQHAINDACSGQCAPEFIWQSLLEAPLFAS